jgi:hypothetical protein
MNTNGGYSGFIRGITEKLHKSGSVKELLLVYGKAV